jgi:hypothetical protein
VAGEAACIKDLKIATNLIWYANNYWQLEIIAIRNHDVGARFI